MAKEETRAVTKASRMETGLLELVKNDEYYLLNVDSKLQRS